ncbi:hypothetical protein [Curtobacterium sp. MCSS17_016]|uniref:hypothetical protein n=1 Tax=Curtobacterium sp. MCSS17_016 TaxID=2175644 RepID=UPI0011B702F7|nr:hypothetical protein [Curtobacterium sp. MCSS17_016]WIE81097.1 hypothetical protein DEJ19_021720 [Curtobacterium sp. MCSS17_016]
MTDNLDPTLRRMVENADQVERVAAEQFRAEQAMITPSAKHLDEFTRAAMVLNLLANGREQYAENAPEGVRENLLREVNAFRIGAKVLAGDAWAAHSTLPSWKWDEFDRAVSAVGLELAYGD